MNFKMKTCDGRMDMSEIMLRSTTMLWCMLKIFNHLLGDAMVDASEQAENEGRNHTRRRRFINMVAM